MLKLDYSADQFTEDLALIVAILEEVQSLYDLDDGLSTLVDVATIRLRDMERSVVEPFVLSETSSQEYVN